MSLFKASYAPVTVKLLLMKTSGRGPARLSALHMVAVADKSICAGILELLLEHGADVNAKDDGGRTPLYCTVAYLAEIAAHGDMLEYGHVLRGHPRVSDVDTVKLLLEGALSARASFGAAEVVEVSVAWLCVFFRRV